MDSPLCLLTVHAHPDDESSKGAGTVAHYHSRGVNTVLVCCTGGEEGEILNPQMDRPEIRADIGAVRKLELEQATKIIGYNEVVWLGYLDSGMAGTPANENPLSFAKAPLDEEVEALVKVLRRERPQVVVTYEDPEGQKYYPHPDHLRVHEVTVAAFDASGDPGRFPAAGEPWAPQKLYYLGWSTKMMVAVHEKFQELGQESPFDEKWMERMRRPHPPASTIVDITDFANVRREALLAHATQVDPNSKMWFGLSPEVSRTLYPFDEYRLARDRTGRFPTDEIPADIAETDLFEGVS